MGLLAEARRTGGGGGRKQRGGRRDHGRRGEPDGSGQWDRPRGPAGRLRDQGGGRADPHHAAGLVLGRAGARSMRAPIRRLALLALLAAGPAAAEEGTLVSISGGGYNTPDH